MSLRGTLVIEGIHLAPNMVVAFPSSPGARISSFSPAARLRRSGNVAGRDGALARPLGAHQGAAQQAPLHELLRPDLRVRPLDRARPPPSWSTRRRRNPSVFDGQGMWIWYMSASDKGSVAAIAEQAHAAGVTTLFIKSSDGSTNYWSQFSPQLVGELHAAGLKVCAWQYVYGSNPAGEAALGAEAVANGAECLVIDAEAEYEGHYAAAQTYLADLRAKIGSAYPLGLASFPYVSYHPTFPYSVFLGPEGAQFNLPQMYWKDIGQSVDTVYANTYIANRVYARPIYPLGQTYGGVSSSDLLRFREEAVDYGATGLLLLGLAGDPRLGVDHAGGAAGAPDERHAEHRPTRNSPEAARATPCCGCRSTWPARSPPRKRPASSPARRSPTWRASRPATGSPPAGWWKRPPGRPCWRSRRWR